MNDLGIQAPESSGNTTCSRIREPPMQPQLAEPPPSKLEPSSTSLIPTMVFPTRTSGSLCHVILLFVTLLFVEFFCGARSRKCDRHGYKGLKKAMEFDLQLQTKECVKTGSKEIDKLPWKGGSDANPDYECLQSELRKMAPPNGFALLLFWARCGCPVAKLEGWGPKRGRRHKK
ncbi:uncharacterized protein At5g19025-like [Rosa rugosa]|uniref:uncharacterized protein At5g19025-like n=1 Tax=Rosa rugosa TaxID=74645 RepID=UPI002B416DF1|nr:uncharacterized protein At5g19025-like [Rosa rugosa]